MISLFRRHLQGRFLRYVIYVVSFFIIFPSAFVMFFRWFESPHWAIKVNSQTIETEEYQRQVYNVQQQIVRLKQMLGEYADVMLSSQGLAGDPQKLAINSLVEQKSLEQTADKLHIKLSPIYVSQQLIRMVPREVVLPDGSIDMQRLAQAYQMSYSQLEEQFNNQMISQLLMQLTEGAIYLPTFLLKEKFIQAYTDRTFLIAEFPLRSLINQEEKKAVSDEELQSFFAAENKKNKRYWVPEKRAGILWRFDPGHYNMKISEKQIERYYNQNKYKEFIDEPAKIQVRRIKMHFTDKDKSSVRARLTKIKQELDKDPKLFAQKAQEFSEDKVSKKKGGLLDYFARGTYDQQFEQAAFRLQKDGDISSIVETSNSFELIQRVAKKAQTFKPIERVKNEIKQKLATNQFKRIFAHDVRRCLAQEDKLQALEELAKKRHGKKEVINLTKRGNEPYMQKFFSVKKNSGGSLLVGDDGYAFFVTEVKKSYQPKFDTVKNEVRHDLYRSRAEKVLKKILEEGEKITDTGKFEQFADKHGASLEATGRINQGMQQEVQKLSKRLGGQVNKLFVLTVPGKVIAFNTMAFNGAEAGLLVCLETIAPFDETKFKEQKEALARELYQEQKGLIEQAFIASLLKNATIKINEKIIK